LEIGGLEIELIFNENVIKPRDNEEYIKEAVDIIVILYVKREYNCKNNVLVYFKASLNWTTKIKLTKIIKFLCSWYRAAGFNLEIYKVYWMYT